MVPNWHHELILQTTVSLIHGAEFAPCSNCWFHHNITCMDMYICVILFTYLNKNIGHKKIWSETKIAGQIWVFSYHIFILSVNQLELVGQWGHVQACLFCQQCKRCWRCWWINVIMYFLKVKTKEWCHGPAAHKQIAQLAAGHRPKSSVGSSATARARSPRILQNDSSIGTRDSQLVTHLSCNGNNSIW